jgi:hypothetical protein
MTPKRWYTSKTLWVNALTLLIMVLGTVAQWPEFADYAAHIAGIVAAINLILRVITDRPVV